MGRAYDHREEVAATAARSPPVNMFDPVS